MKLGEFIKRFSRNNIIRLVYKVVGGHETVGKDWEASTMDWEVLKAKGIFRHYIDNKVLGLAGICTGGNYPETINIVIEKLVNQPQIEEAIDEQQSYECANN